MEDYTWNFLTNSDSTSYRKIKGGFCAKKYSKRVVTVCLSCYTVIEAVFADATHVMLLYSICGCCVVLLTCAVAVIIDVVVANVACVVTCTIVVFADAVLCC